MKPLSVNRLLSAAALVLTALLHPTASPTVTAATTEGIITGSETWSGTVSLLGDVTVSTNATLTILPGTRIQCDAARDSQRGGINPNRIELIVLGSLNAAGTAAAPILFTSWPDDPKTPPRPGDWHGVRLLPGTNQTITLAFASVEFGTEGVAVETTLAAPVSDCFFQSNSISALTVSRPLTLLNSTLRANQGGLRVMNTTAAVTNCHFIANAEFGAQTGAGSSSLTADHCLVASHPSSGFNYFATLVFRSSQCISNAVGLQGTTLEITDSIVEHCGAISVYAERLTARNTRFANGMGLVVLGEATVEDCEFLQSRGAGLVVGKAEAWYAGPPGPGWLNMVRSRVEGSSGAGVALPWSGTAWLTDSVLTGNASQGIQVLGDVTAGYGPTDVSLLNCLIFDNAEEGLLLNGVGPRGLHGNTIENNRVGLTINSADLIQGDRISGNCIERNGEFEFRNDGAGGIVANGNYWGQPTTTELQNGQRNLSRIRDSRDLVTVGPVYLVTWLDTCPCALPIITADPADITVTEGSTACFRVEATGQSLRYQWRKGGTALAGATGPTLCLEAVRGADAGPYDVVVANDCGAVTSLAAQLIIKGLPVIVKQPQPVKVAQGATARFSVAATSADPLTYQWRFNGQPMANGGRFSGVSTAELTISSAQPPDEGQYSVVVSNVAGAVTSVPAALTVITPPVITQHPVTVVVLPGRPAEFSVLAGGRELTYQWKFDGQDLPGATGPVLRISESWPADVGAYTVVVANLAASVSSSPAGLWLEDLKFYAGVNVVAPVGSRCRIDYSTNLTQWTVWTNLTIQSTPQVLIDYDSPDHPVRHYRTVPPP